MGCHSVYGGSSRLRWLRNHTHVTMGTLDTYCEWLLLPKWRLNTNILRCLVCRPQILASEIVCYKAGKTSELSKGKEREGESRNSDNVKGKPSYILTCFQGCRGRDVSPERQMLERDSQGSLYSCLPWAYRKTPASQWRSPRLTATTSLPCSCEAKWPSVG